MLLAVYGTLKTGRINHDILKRHRPIRVGDDYTHEITLYREERSKLPCAKKKRPKYPSYIEIWDITPECLAAMDKFEGYKHSSPKSSLYVREMIPTRFGPAWVYLWNSEISGKEFTSL